MFKTLLLSAAFVGASVIGAAAQSTTTPSASGGANVSAATHCKDRTTGQARLKTAANTGSTTFWQHNWRGERQLDSPKEQQPGTFEQQRRVRYERQRGFDRLVRPDRSGSKSPDCQ